MKVSGVERSTEAEDTESDDLGGKEVLVGNVSGESATENPPYKVSSQVPLSQPLHMSSESCGSRWTHWLTTFSKWTDRTCWGVLRVLAARRVDRARRDIVNSRGVEDDLVVRCGCIIGTKGGSLSGCSEWLARR